MLCSTGEEAAVRCRVCGAHHTPISLPVCEWRGMWRLCVLLTEFSFSSMTLDFFFLPSSRYQIERTCQGALGCWKTDYSNECFDFYLVSSFPSVVLQGFLDKLYSAGDPSDVDLKVYIKSKSFSQMGDRRSCWWFPGFWWLSREVGGRAVRVLFLYGSEGQQLCFHTSLSNFLRWQTYLLHIMPNHKPYLVKGFVYETMVRWNGAEVAQSSSQPPLKIVI